MSADTPAKKAPAKAPAKKVAEASGPKKERRTPRQQAQDNLDTANRKIERARKRKDEALATMQTIGAEIAQLVRERDYLAANPALRDVELVVVGEVMTGWEVDPPEIPPTADDIAEPEVVIADPPVEGVEGVSEESIAAVDPAGV